MAVYSKTQLLNMSASSQDMASAFDCIRNAFLSCSFVRTVQGPSGSLTSPDDFSVLSPTTNRDQPRAFDVFAFNDSWQATRPLFIKVEYRSGLAAPYLGLHVYMGSKHDNSGSLISVDTISQVFDGTGASPATPFSDIVSASGDGSYFTLVGFAEQRNSWASEVIVCERLYDAYGRPTGSGFHLISSTHHGTIQQATYYQQPPPPAEISSIMHTRPPVFQYDGELRLGLVHPYIGQALNPSPNVLIGDTTQFSRRYQRINYVVYRDEYIYINCGQLDSNNSAPMAAPYEVAFSKSNARWVLRMTP